MGGMPILWGGPRAYASAPVPAVLACQLVLISHGPPGAYPGTIPVASLPMDSSSDGFQTLCAYARLYIEEYHEYKEEVDELERIIASLSSDQPSSPSQPPLQS